MTGDPDEGPDVLAFGDPEPRGPRRWKRLAMTGTVVAGAAIAVSALALNGTGHAPAPARNTARPAAETIADFQGSYVQVLNSGAITAPLPAGTSHIVTLDPVTGHPACP